MVPNKHDEKKAFKTLGILVVAILILLIAVPFFLEGKIETIIKNKVNENINATFDFKEANLSLLKSFPKAYVDLKEVSIVNKAPFEGDTLFSAADIELDLAISELFKSEDEPIGIERFSLQKAVLQIKVDSLENANYDIAKPSSNKASPEEESTNSFTLNLEEYAITNAFISYDDYASGMHLELSEIYHSGSGDLSLNDSKLKTKTDALVSFEMDKTRYLNNNKVALDALIGIDLEQSKYTFLENSALVNQLPLVFDGFVKLNETNQEVAINFKTPSSDFKNFLAVIPEAYAANLDGVTTTGNFEIDGHFKGIVDDIHIPTFNINILSKNAGFKYADLPKSVQNVNIDTHINNDTGIVEDTYVLINKLSFLIDKDAFNVKAAIRELLGNTKVNLHADGQLNLANIAKAYPMPELKTLKGILAGDITTAFDMASLENHNYANTKTEGDVRLSDFYYESSELKNPVTINSADLSFNPKRVALNEFSGTMGQTDFNAKGTIDNLLGYVFNDENIEGKFQLNSDTFAVSDFVVEEEVAQEESVPTAPETVERIKIPSFLDCTIDAEVANVIYDNLKLTNLKGRLKVHDEAAELENLKANLLGGTVNLNGLVSTKGPISAFDVGMGIDNFNLGQSFQALDVFKVIAPLAEALKGTFNANFKLAGNLKDDMTPNLGTLSGNLLAELLGTEVNTRNNALLSSLNNQFDFIDFSQLNLNDLKTAFSFDDGKVAVKPFSLNYKDIAVEVSGNHSFDMNMDYNTTFDVPAKYLGKEVTDLIAKLNDENINEMTIPVTTNIGGNYKSPQIKTDLKSGVTTLTKQLVAMQKQKLVNQGEEKVKNLIGGLFNKKSDSTAATEKNGNTTSNLSDTDTKDSTANKTVNAAKSLLGGLLGKKKDTTKQ